MKKLLYLTTWDFSDGPSTGITNKIKSQIRVFKENGFEVDYTCIYDNAAYFHKDGQSIYLGKVGKFRKLAAYYYLYRTLKKEYYPYIYNRYGLMDKFYFKLIKKFSEKGSKIVVEIPAYPYDKERPHGLAWWMLYSLDKFYRNKIKKFVNIIATYSEDEKIFGINTIQIHNGINFDDIMIRKPKNKTNEIRLIAVAGLAWWHGYDRILRGIGEYYKNGGERKVIIHVVGDGEPLSEYKKIVEEYAIQEYCIFHGVKRGEELNKIYDVCDIGVECLGIFRKKLLISSSLKSREYGAKGLPFVMAGQSDVFENKEFVLKVPEDETPINIESIAMFYDKMYNGKSKLMVAEEIRRQAKVLCDIQITMKPVIEYFIDGGRM